MAITRLLNLKEVAQRLGQSVTTVTRRIANRELRAVKLSKHAWRVDEADLTRYIAERATEARAITPRNDFPDKRNGDVMVRGDSWRLVENPRRRRHAG